MIHTYPIGLEIYFTDCLSIGLAALEPVDNLQSGAWNWLDLVANVGPLNLLLVQLSPERLTVGTLNFTVSIFWSC